MIVPRSTTTYQISKSSRNGLDDISYSVRNESEIWYFPRSNRKNHGPFSLVQLCRWKSCGHFPPVELYSGSFCDFGKTMAFGELFPCKKGFFYTFTVRGECLCNHFSPPQVSLQLKTSSLLCNYPHTNPNTCRLHRSYALGKLTALKQQMCGATSHDDMP
ncbi:unnamed protein product [Brassica oleracea var. botrytis]|uniref:(rape) hypothetical protein n=1 Tax=Brassica napus TaxID=3708 RepID=A0A816RAS8_BRANA|nr:unnamed protein product [Brassica napus]